MVLYALLVVHAEKEEEKGGLMTEKAVVLQPKSPQQLLFKAN